MRGLSRIALASLIGLAVSTAALCAEAKAGGAKPVHPAAKKAVTMTPDQLKWVSNPGADDVSTAVVWGDMNKGPHGAFHKLPAGFTSPLHTHSSYLRIIVVSGTMALAGADGVETKLPAGSYFDEPTTYKHVTKCLAGSECLAFVVASGKFDRKPVEAKTEEPKK